MIPFGYGFLMKSVILPLGCILMLTGLLFFSVRLPQHIHDGFEANRLNLFRWSTRRLVAGAVQSETAVVHSGSRALASTAGTATGTRLRMTGVASFVAAELHSRYYPASSEPAI
jgi:hypothetical protein